MTTPGTVVVSGHNGYQLNCQLWTADNPVAVLVLLHGVISHADWLATVASGVAAKGISCLVMDRRGAGRNSVARGDVADGETLTSDLRAVLDYASTLCLPLHVGGFCWGANYLVNYLAAEQSAANQTNKRTLQSIALMAPSLFPSALITEQHLETGTSASASETPLIPLEAFTQGSALADFIVPDPLRLKKVSPRFNHVMAEYSQGLWMKFLRLKNPVMVVLGEHDDVVDNRATQQVYERLRTTNKCLHMLPGMHGIQFDASDEVIRLLVNWVKDNTTHLRQV